MKIVREMVDVNDYHQPTDIKAYFKAGYPYLGVKVTEGTNYTSQIGLGIVVGVRKVGGRTLFYHFATCASSGADQAHYFLHAISPYLKKGDAVCLDIEGQPQHYQQWRLGLPAAVARDFTAYINKHLPKGVRKLIYSNSAFFVDQPITKPRGWHRWVASYGVRPTFWPRRCVGWQFTDAASGIPGMPAGVDASVIRGVLIPSITHRITPHRRHPKLRLGARGHNVRVLQELLNTHGERLVVDGFFGNSTAAAVRHFKVKHHLSNTAVCGRRCWKALEV